MMARIICGYCGKGFHENCYRKDDIKDPCRCPVCW